MNSKITKFLSLAALICIVSGAMALNPSKTYKDMPDKYGMKYKEAKIPTKDGASLNSWYFENPKKVPNYIIISASGDGNMADNLEIISQFLSAGYNVLAYDYRGYGKSSDFNIDKDVFIYPQFNNDLNAAIDYLRKTYAVTRLDLYGIAIGGGLSLGVGANRTEIRKIIADGPWISLEKTKAKIKDKTGKDVIVPFGFDKNYEPMYGLASAKPHIKSILIIVASADEIISPMDVKGIAGSETYIPKGSMSNKDNFSTDKNAYFTKISGFLKN